MPRAIGNWAVSRPIILQRKIAALGKSPTACSLLAQPCRETKNPAGRTRRGFYSGDVLLSRGLSPHYHRGCSVSLPCSEWERVVPLRYYHQRSEPDWRFAAPQRRKRESASLMTMSIVQLQKNCWFSDIYIQEARIESNNKASFYLDHSFPIAAVPLARNSRVLEK